MNNQKVADMDYTTNEFGSFSGSFDAPQGLINGTMRIMDANRGSVSFSVEEYKKPEYLVEVSTGKNQYAAGDRISGKVKADPHYAHNGEAWNFTGSTKKLSQKRAEALRH